jgi:hypothetical protein
VEQEVPQDSPAWVWHADPSTAHMALSPHGESVQPDAQQTLFVPIPSLMQLA